MNTAKIAKCQVLGTCVRLYDAETNQDIAVVVMSKREMKGQMTFVERVQAKAIELGYETPSIHPGKDGILRIWL